MNRAIKSSIEGSLQSELTTLLQIEKSMLEKWFAHQEANAIAMASGPEIRTHVSMLLELYEELASGKVQTPLKERKQNSSLRPDVGLTSCFKWECLLTILQAM